MTLNRQKHVRYWRMCANILPDAYQSSDASRMFLGFFIVAALDLLDVFDNPQLEKPVIAVQERKDWIDWIYSCQVPDGQGFRGFTGTDLRDRRSSHNKQWDPGNLPNTFFALAALLTLNDDLSRVRRKELLSWLPRLQRPDGSFGEILGPDDEIEGGRDLRYCCCAAGIAYILQDPATEPYQSPFDENRLIDYILSCQTYAGGFAESPLREPHSGLSYCAIATLQLLTRLDGTSSRRARETLDNQESCMRWLLERQTTVLYEERPESDEADSDDEEPANNDGSSTVNSFADSPMYYTPPLLTVGFNGRDNKIADTCYCFWNSGALAILGSLHLADLQAVRRYLLDKVQHIIGGFAKGPESPPGHSIRLSGY
ncbi:geranylgeranyl transferase type-1 subunit beta [Lithohypha guttulata]|uniref:geranylgeranyl transferase type-1 subunit beta n=1 Tax=Lithohypha guttulata TaxID=1690604 RepID=UPI00315CE7E7